MISELTQPPDFARDIPFLREFYGGAFWMGGKDFWVKNDTRIPSGLSFISVSFNQESFFPLDGLTQVHTRYAAVAGRSRTAQAVRLDIFENIPQ